MESFANLLDNGLNITINDQQKKLTFKIMILIADNVAFPKVFNFNQYNGFYGCIKCLHPVQSIVKPRKKRVYTYLLKEGVIVIQKDFSLDPQKATGVPNLQVWMLLRSLKDRGFV